jgi:hypothetical protein
MGWTSCWKWTTPTVLRREYEEDMARSGRIKTFGWCGSFLKCLDTQTDRPFLVDVMVHKFGKREYGYKDIETSSGPSDTNTAAARWLRRELAKRNLAPANAYEASWLLRCDRKERQAKTVQSFKAGDVLEARCDFELNSGIQYQKGDKFDVKSVKRGRIFCTPHGVSWPFMSLSGYIFAGLQYEDYPLMVV